MVPLLVNWIKFLFRDAVNIHTEHAIMGDKLEILVVCRSWRVIKSNVTGNDEPNSITEDIVEILCNLFFKHVVVLSAVRFSFESVN